jgi:hypothetical protein
MLPIRSGGVMKLSSSAEFRVERGSGAAWQQFQAIVSLSSVSGRKGRRLKSPPQRRDSHLSQGLRDASETRNSAYCDAVSPIPSERIVQSDR